MPAEGCSPPKADVANQSIIHVGRIAEEAPPLELVPYLLREGRGVSKDRERLILPNQPVNSYDSSFVVRTRLMPEIKKSRPRAP